MRGVLFIVALSLFFAYLLFPLVRLAQRWLIQSRPLAIVVVHLVVLAALGGAGVAIGPRLLTEVQSLAQKLPEMSTQIQSEELVMSLLARQGERGSRSVRSTSWCKRTWERSSATLSGPRWHG
jgi:predicted PurR-regulated permease PerM